MASESSTERTVSVTLPAELDEWLDDRAGELSLDREQLLVQLLASYHTASELDDDAVDSLALDGDELEGQVDELLAERLDEELPERLLSELDDRLDGEVDQRIQQQVAAAVDAALTDQVNEATKSVQRQLTNRIDAVESEFTQKIEDVRERVIQVKTETDSKAPAEHHHGEFDHLDRLADTVADLEAELESLRTEFDATVPDTQQTVETVDERMQEMQDRLQTVAWVVSDLREAQESKGGLEAVERIKRAAAKADIERASCQNCGEGVTLSLLTDPECPHCNATVTNVEPSGGWFGSAKLLTASQLESGEQ